MSTQEQPSGWVPGSSFGSRLLEIRRHLSLTSEQLAARCDIPVVTWRRWEKGVHPRDLADVVRVVHEETGVDRDWLMWGDPVTTPYSGWFTADDVRLPAGNDRTKKEAA